MNIEKEAIGFAITVAAVVVGVFVANELAKLLRR